MKIRRYIGKDAQDAMMKVRMDLGSDAVILNTRKIKQKGLVNLFSKPLVEVLAAIDQDVAKQTEPDISSKTPDKIKVNQNKPVIDSKVAVQREEAEADIHVKELENKVKNMESMLEKIYQQMQSPNNVIAVSEQETDRILKLLEIFSNNLLKNNVDIDITNELIMDIKQNAADKKSINDIAAKMYSNIIKILDDPQPIQLNNNDHAKIIAFVGPTGVGKTTTLAKIAAIFAIKHHKNIGIITSDTYRIAAVEQLKTYSEILGLPVQVIYSPEEVEQAIEKFKDKDLVLIDTAGRSHKDIEQFEELKRIIELSNPDEVYLLLSLTTDYNVCKDITKSYTFLKDYRIIFTKMDEAASCGIILNIAKYASCKLSYITTGQSVPDDIEVLNTDKIAKKLLGSIQI
ncbi:MAG: flagellar biosynthesis protein FlhF [Clostridia bacterium]